MQAVALLLDDELLLEELLDEEDVPDPLLPPPPPLSAISFLLEGRYVVSLAGFRTNANRLLAHVV